MANELGVSQASYSKIENGQIIPKIDRLQHIAKILEVDLSTLLSTTNNFSFVFNSVTNQTNNIVDI